MNRHLFCWILLFYTQLFCKLMALQMNIFNDVSSVNFQITNEIWCTKIDLKLIQYQIASAIQYRFNKTVAKSQRSNIVHILIHFRFEVQFYLENIIKFCVFLAAVTLSCYFNIFPCCSIFLSLSFSLFFSLSQAI